MSMLQYALTSMKQKNYLNISSCEAELNSCEFHLDIFKQLKLFFG